MSASVVQHQVNLDQESLADSGLPEGWVASTVGQTCDLNPTKPPKNALPADAPVTFVPMAAVDAESGTISSLAERPYGEIRGGYTAFRDGDVIMAKITPCMENGKAAIARSLANGMGFGSTEFHVLRPTGAATPEFLFHYIRQDSFRKAAEAEMRGAVGQWRVPAEFLESAALPLPPLAEQQRIVEAVEALLAQVNTARQRLAKVPTILKRFRRSVLAAACSGRLTEDWRISQSNSETAHDLIDRVRTLHASAGFGYGGKAAPPTDDVHTLSASELPETWAVAPLMWLCGPGRPITYGILKPGPDVDDGVPYVRVADYPNGQLVVSGVRRTSLEIAHAYRRSALRAGDVLLAIRGTYGRVCRVPAELAGANITQDTARVSVHDGLSADYVELYLRCPSVQDRLSRAAKGVAVRGVNIGDVRALQVSVPPLTEQQEVVRRVGELFALADAIERRVKAATARAERLTQAVLARAFRGELVPTEAELARREGRSYEPAEVLFRRIAGSRAEAGKAAASVTERQRRWAPASRMPRLI